MSKYKVINEVVINKKVITAGEIVELDDKELNKIMGVSSLELIESEEKPKGRQKKQIKEDDSNGSSI